MQKTNCSVKKCFLYGSYIYLVKNMTVVFHSLICLSFGYDFPIWIFLEFDIFVLLLFTWSCAEYCLSVAPLCPGLALNKFTQHGVLQTNLLSYSTLIQNQIFLVVQYFCFFSLFLQNGIFGKKCISTFKHSFVLLILVWLNIIYENTLNILFC